MSKCPFFGFMDALFWLAGLALLVGVAALLFGWAGVIGLFVLLAMVTWAQRLERQWLQRRK